MADYNSERQGEARRAYGDPEQSKRVHGHMMETFNVDIRKNGAMRNRAVVLGALTGLCTAASALGVVRASPHLFHAFLASGQSPKVLAWSLTSGLGLAFCVTVSFVNERAVYDLEFSRELWEIDNCLSGELLEMIAIYRNQGLTEEEAHVVTRIFAKQKHLFASLMMVEELGYSRLEPPTVREVITNAAVPASAGYLVGLAAPILILLKVYARGMKGGSGQGSEEGAVVAAELSTSLRRLGAVLLAASTAFVSYLQSEVFFGAYTNRRIFLRTAAANVTGVGAIYALSYLSAKCL